MNLTTTLVADGAGMWSGAKVGGAIGAVLGPKGAVFGGVVGSIIGGSTASWGTARGLGLVAPSLPSSWNVGSPYNTFPYSPDSLGWLHNESVKYLTSNAVLNSDGSINYSQFHTLLVNYLSSRGWDSVATYFPYNEFYSVAAPFEACSTLADIESHLNSEFSSTNPTEVGYWGDICDSLQTLATSGGTKTQVISALQGFESGVNNLDISNERKEHLKMGIRGARWSFILWEENS